MIWYNQEQKSRGMKSFSAFLHEKSDIFKNGNFICINCNGRKKVIADYEIPDPVEGYKMADTVVCPHCGGTGQSTEKDWRDFFKAEQKNHREQQKEIKKINVLKRQGLAKLTKEEREALGL